MTFSSRPFIIIISIIIIIIIIIIGSAALGRPLPSLEALPIRLCRWRSSSNSWPRIFSYLDQLHLPIAISIFELFLLHPVWCWIFFLRVLSFDVCWTVHHCDNWRIKNQPDATCYFIVLLIGSTCFGQYYAHHQELATIMLITTLVVSFLVYCRLEVRCG